MSLDKKQKRDAQLFEELLMASFAMEHHRHRKDAATLEAIHAFCQQAISDSKHLVRNRAPDDVIKVLQEERQKKEHLR